MLLIWALVIITILEIVRRRTRQLTAYTVSPNRDQPFVIDLDDGFSVISDGPVYSEFFKGDFLPASVRIQDQQKVYYIDPFLTRTAESADGILITHDHPDHFSPDDIHRLFQPGRTRIFGPRAVAERLPALPVEILKPGESVDLDQWTVTGIPAHATGIPTHPRRSQYLGYLLTCGENRIYHAGDTHVIADLDSLTDLTLAILPIKGSLFTMSTQEAADLVCRIKPQRVFPLHYPLGKDEGLIFAQLVGNASTVILYPEKQKQPS